MLKIVIPFLMVLLSACAPMQRTQESWAREIFGPSAPTLDYACKLAFDIPPEKSFSIEIGQLRIKSSSGRVVRFYSTPGQLYIMCRLFGILAPGANGRDSFLGTEGYRRFRQNARVFAVVEGDDLKPDQVKLEISLESKSGQQVVQLKPNSTESGGYGNRFDFSSIAPEQRIILDDVSSFTLNLIITGVSEKIHVDSSSYSALVKSESQ